MRTRTDIQREIDELVLLLRKFEGEDLSSYPGMMLTLKDLRIRQARLRNELRAATAQEPETQAGTGVSPPHKRSRSLALTTPRFLSIAYALKQITRKQAREVYQEWLWSRGQGIPRHVGDIAVELGYLTKRSREAVLSEMNKDRLAPEAMPDVLRRPGRLRPAKPILQVVLGLMILAGWLLSSAILGVSWGQYAVVFATLLICAHSIVEADESHWLSRAGPWWRQAVRVCLFLGFTVSAMLLLYYGFMLFQSPRRGSPEDTERVTRRLLGLAALLVSYGTTLGILATWRRVRARSLEARLMLTRRLVALLQSVDESTGRDDVSSRLRDVLAVFAAIVQQNPWVDVVARFVWLHRPSHPDVARARRAVTVMYVEPDHETRRFVIRHIICPGCPNEVAKALDDMKHTFHMPFFDADWYGVAIQQTKSVSEFRSIALRDRQVSAPGVVLSTGRAYSVQNIMNCRTFVYSPTAELQPHLHSRRTTRWLDWRSFAAYPVFLDTVSETAPIGVLMVFRNVSQGILRDDRAAAASCARIIASVLGYEALKERSRVTRKQEGEAIAYQLQDEEELVA